VSDRRDRAIRIFVRTFRLLVDGALAMVRNDEQRELRDVAKMIHVMLEQQTALTLAITTLVVQTAPKPPKDDRWPMEKTSDT